MVPQCHGTLSPRWMTNAFWHQVQLSASFLLTVRRRLPARVWGVCGCSLELFCLDWAGWQFLQVVKLSYRRSGAIRIKLSFQFCEKFHPCLASTRTVSRATYLTRFVSHTFYTGLTELQKFTPSFSSSKFQKEPSSAVQQTSSHIPCQNLYRSPQA